MISKSFSIPLTYTALNLFDNFLLQCFSHEIPMTHGNLVAFPSVISHVLRFNTLKMKSYRLIVIQILLSQCLQLVATTTGGSGRWPRIACRTPRRAGGPRQEASAHPQQLLSPPSSWQMQRLSGPCLRRLVRSLNLRPPCGAWRRSGRNGSGLRTCGPQFWQQVCSVRLLQIGDTHA